MKHAGAALDLCLRKLGLLYLRLLQVSELAEQDLDLPVYPHDLICRLTATTCADSIGGPYKD